MNSHFDRLDADTRTTAPDTWGMAHGQDARLAYQARLAQWILLITTGAGGMTPYSAPGTPEMAGLASLIGVPQLADPLCTAAGICVALQHAADVLPIHLVSVSQSGGFITRALVETDLGYYALMDDVSLNKNEALTLETRADRVRLLCDSQHRCLRLMAGGQPQ